MGRSAAQTCGLQNSATHYLYTYTYTHSHVHTLTHAHTHTQLLSMDVSGSGALGVCSSEDGRLWVWDADTGETRVGS